MSAITRADLLSNPKLLSLVDPQSATDAGISVPENLTPKNASSPSATLKDAFANLTPAQKKRLKGTEAKQHAVLVNWLAKHEIPFIHAPTSRKVHDLPVGWPDFSIFRKSAQAAPLGLNHCLFIEIKVPGGVFSWEQLYWQKLLIIHIRPSAYEAIALAAAFCRIELPVLGHQPDLYGR